MLRKLASLSINRSRATSLGSSNMATPDWSTQLSIRVKLPMHGPGPNHREFNLVQLFGAIRLIVQRN